MMDADAFAALGAKMISNSSSASAAPTPPANDAFDGILKLSALKDDAKNELVEFLDSLRGSKCLMIDPQLAGVINSLLLPDGFKCLKEQGVTSLKELRSVDRNHTVAAIDSLISDIVVDITKESLDNVIFLVRPHLPMMKHIAKLVNAALKGGNMIAWTLRYCHLVLSNFFNCTFPCIIMSYFSYLIFLRWKKSIPCLLCTSSYCDL